MKTDQTKKSNLKNKLLSYSALSAAFLLVDSEAQAQCGVADAVNPVLAVDIDGDGNADVNINFNTLTGTATLTSSVAGVASTNLYTTVAGVLTGSTYIGPNVSYYGCQPLAIPGQYGNGYGGGSFFQGDPALGSYTTITATAPIYVQVNVLNTFQYYFTYVSGSVAYALASGVGSNNIVGVTAGASNLAVCGLIDNSAGVNGTGSVSIGSVYDVSYYFFSVQAAQSAQLVYQPAAVNPFPTTTCQTSSYATYGVYLPPASPIASFPGSTITTVGPFALATPNTSTGTLVGSNVSANFLAVQFISGGETYNGWVELSYDVTTGAVTCLSTGYNSCSIEDASMANPSTSPDACIAVGQADPNGGIGCSDDVTIPTLSQWGLITLMLLLMNFGSLALVSFNKFKEVEQKA